MDLANPVIRSHYRNGFIKQYVRDHLILRTEPTRARKGSRLSDLARTSVKVP